MAPSRQAKRVRSLTLYRRVGGTPKRYGGVRSTAYFSM